MDWGEKGVCSRSGITKHTSATPYVLRKSWIVRADLDTEVFLEEL